MTEKSPKQKIFIKHQWLLIAVAVIFFILLATGAGAVYLSHKDANKIASGIYVGKIYVGGLTTQQALEKINEINETFENLGVNLKWQDKTINISFNLTSSPDLDFKTDIYTGDPAASLERAIQTSKSKNSWEEIYNRGRLWLISPSLPFAYNLNETMLKAYLQATLSDYVALAENARIKIKKNNGGLTAEILAEKNGATFNYDQIISKLKEKIANLDYSALTIEEEVAQPTVKLAQAQALLPQINQLINNTSTIQLVYQDKNWPVSAEKLNSWLTFSMDNNGQAVLALDKILVEKFLEKIADEINTEVEEPKFKVANGKVTEFTEPKNGLKLNLEKSYELINAEFSDKPEKINLITEIVEPKINVANINDLGIKEIIGIGKSNFKGSPNNRRINIKVGAKSLTGLIIKPGEEFSLVTALGEIDGDHGYLPELVIKDNKTIPEYGGGLCQIGTTIFRAALASGLPITERSNHSYRVSYYEPAGTDATIYNPRPDLKFVNDTGNNILIQTKISGNDLIFEFWGTKDGRQVSQSAPKIYNITIPKPTKIVETVDLKPGEKKCTESAHNGADADFTYTVTYADSTVKEKIFHSHYKPWQAVCLIGVTAPTIEPAAATSTAENPTVLPATP